uniref:Uncharacterized protein n=1 Tax=Timema shepardi TaxID=629360 RepID=A0A7R9AS56_TIMSH|nr:unnamed protein product [Timema shepardi]
MDGDNSPAQLSLEFRVFLVSGQTGKHTQESRTLQFWFITNISESDQASVAQEFFKELVSPQEFPRGCYAFLLFPNTLTVGESPVCGVARRGLWELIREGEGRESCRRRVGHEEQPKR